MIKIYHNNRCRKSREGLQLLETSGKHFEIVNYLENVPSLKDLKNIVDLLGIAPIELVRKNEAIWKTEFKNRDLTDKEILEAVIKFPKLIERPIVINGNKAAIGRPPTKILEII